MPDETPPHSWPEMLCAGACEMEDSDATRGLVKKVRVLPCLTDETIPA